MKSISIDLVKEIYSKLLDLNIVGNYSFDCDNSSMFESFPIEVQSYCIQDYKNLICLCMDLDEIIKDYENEHKEL